MESAHPQHQTEFHQYLHITVLFLKRVRLEYIRRVVNKHWDILKIKINYEQAFTELPKITFRRNRNLQNIFGKKTIVNNRKQLCQNFSNNTQVNLKQFLIQDITTIKKM